MYVLRGDKAEYKLLAHRLATVTSFPVAILNYRLTTPENKLQHPGHAQDVLDFFEFALDWDGPSGPGTRPYDPSRIYALGHSCAAHMLTSIFLCPPPAFQSSAVTPPSPRLLQAVRGVMLSGGAFDLDQLVRVAPKAKSLYIALPFGDLPSYEAFNTTKWEFREGGEHYRWLVVRSEGDKVVDRATNEVVVTHLEELLSKAGGRGSVETHWELTGGHNEMLHEEDYPRVVASFVLKSEGDA